MDIDSKLKALKAAWVPRFLNSNSTISKIFKGILSNLNKTLTLPYILQFSQKSPDKLQRIRQIPLFYIQILGAFNECKKNPHKLQTKSPVVNYYNNHNGITPYSCTKGSHYFSKLEDKKIAKFNYKLLNYYKLYKLLNNILCNNLYLSKWNVNKTSTCETCNKDENTKHLIFYCSFNGNI